MLSLAGVHAPGSDDVATALAAGEKLWVVQGRTQNSARDTIVAVEPLRRNGRVRVDPLRRRKRRLVSGADRANDIVAARVSGNVALSGFE